MLASARSSITSLFPLLLYQAVPQWWYAASPTDWAYHGACATGGYSRPRRRLVSHFISHFVIFLSFTSSLLSIVLLLLSLAFFWEDIRASFISTKNDDIILYWRIVHTCCCPNDFFIFLIISNLFFLFFSSFPLFALSATPSQMPPMCPPNPCPYGQSRSPRWPPQIPVLPPLWDWRQEGTRFDLQMSSRPTLVGHHCWRYFHGFQL